MRKLSSLLFSSSPQHRPAQIGNAFNRSTTDEIQNRLLSEMEHPTFKLHCPSSGERMMRLPQRSNHWTGLQQPCSDWYQHVAHWPRKAAAQPTHLTTSELKTMQNDPWEVASYRLKKHQWNHRSLIICTFKRLILFFFF